jgi:hypothetical protein
MRSVRGFVALVSFGLLAAGAIAVVGAGEGARFSNASMPNSMAIDYRSLTIGLVLGLLLSSAARLPWGDLPRRFITWLWANERNFYRAGMAAVLLGVLLFY